jgi:acyl-CoA thioesterase YciA
MSEPYTALQVVMMPSDANPIPTLTPFPGGGQSTLYSTIFGGVILSHIDMAGAIAARREVQLRGGAREIVLVTVAINRVEFKKPVLVGDVVRYQTTVTRIGRTSITIHVNVFAERGAEVIPVTEAEVVYVGIRADDPERRPAPLLPDSPAAT